MSAPTPSVRPSRKNLGSPRYTLTWDKYHGHEVIHEFIDELAATYDFVNTVSIGKTVEGRDLRVIQIAKAGPGKPNVFIDAGQSNVMSSHFNSFSLCTYSVAQKQFKTEVNYKMLSIRNYACLDVYKNLPKR